MNKLTREQHHARQQNLRYAHDHIHACEVIHTVTDYRPGQVIYNLGEYPKPFSIAPDTYDFELLSLFEKNGVELIQFHEEYTDSIRVLGADKLSSHDPTGLRKMIDLIHTLNMKVLLYVSSGYFDRRDPDFQPDWAHPNQTLSELYFQYAKCSPASASWRAYLLPRLEQLLLSYGADGLYNDLGYAPLWKIEDMPCEHVPVAPETQNHDATLEDLLCIIYDMVKRYGGIVKIHYGGASMPQMSSTVYDYLWVGEGPQEILSMGEQTGKYPPFVVPCIDLSRSAIESEHDLYTTSIPYMQFPLRVDGRPCTGERGMVDSIKYQPQATDFWGKHCHDIHAYWKEHLKGPFIYNLWDAATAREGARQIWFDYLKLYRPMVVDHSKVMVDIKRSDLFEITPQQNTTVSLFANHELYLVAANRSSTQSVLHTIEDWQNRRDGHVGRTWTIAPGTLLFLAKNADRSCGHN